MSAKDVERLVESQRKAISDFFGLPIPPEIPVPPDQLFDVAERIRQEKLFIVAPFYLPKCRLVEAANFPGMKWPLNRLIYQAVRLGKMNQDAEGLPGEWILIDVTKRPNYDDGRQMYPDTHRFKDILAALREQGRIQESPDYIDYVPYHDVPKDSRFAVSADEVDGRKGFVAKEVAAILGLNAKQIITPAYSVFNYIGNLAHPEFGQATTWEWFSNRGYGLRLHGGSSYLNGLSDLVGSSAFSHRDVIGFRLQIRFPSKKRRPHSTVA